MRKEISRSLEAFIQTDYMGIKNTYLPAARHFKLLEEVKLLQDGLKTLDKAHSNVGKVSFLRVYLKWQTESRGPQSELLKRQSRGGPAGSPQLPTKTSIPTSLTSQMKAMVMM